MDDQLPSMNNPLQVPPVPAKKKPWLWIGIAVAVIVALLGVGLAFLLGNMSKPVSQKTNGTSAAAKTLFDALGKAASEPIIRVAMLRRTYATNADLASNTNPGFIQSSVAEVSPQNFRALYAQRPYDKETFSMQRCQDGTTYIDGGTTVGRTQPKTLAEANEYLKQMYIVDQPLQFIVCPHVGVMPGGGPDFAPARLSDGVMPVTLSKAQADKWKSQAAELFAVTDQGMVAHGGKQLHKYDVAPRGDAAEVNQRLYDIFYETAEIEKIKRDHPKAEWAFEYITVNGGKRGGVQGFYLVDDGTGLPVYSELQGIDSDNTRDAAVARASIGFNRQTYAFPTALTLELTSPLEILE